MTNRCGSGRPNATSTKRAKETLALLELKTTF